jgi:hypothetical protein
MQNDHEHTLQFDLFLETIRDLKPQLIRSQRNWKQLRDFSISYYQLEDSPAVVITADQFEAVYLKVRAKGGLEYEEPPVAKRKGSSNDHLMDVGIRPSTGLLSHRERVRINNENSKQAHEKIERIKTSKQQRADAELKWREENETFFRGDGRIDHAKTQNARAAARAKWAAKSKT